MNKRVQSDFLFAQPSFASGAARVIDLWGELDVYNDSDTEADADARALAADWSVVGQDIVDAMQLLDSEEKSRTAA